MVWRKFGINSKDHHKTDFGIDSLEKARNNNLATLCELRHLQTPKIWVAKTHKTNKLQ